MTNARDIHQEIIDGLEETLNFVKGQPTEGQVTYMFGDYIINPREIREDQLGVTREQFAEMFAIDKANIRNWETGRRKPNQHTLAYLLTISQHPHIVYESLHGTTMQ